MFEDRTDAGGRLAAELDSRDIDADVVLAIPRGALPLGRAVADRLDAPLDVVVAKKIGAPDNPELAIGAVASDGSRWLNDDLVADLGIEASYIEAEQGSVAEQAREKVERYREDDHAPDLEGKRVVVVDDGVATGATAIAVLRQVRALDPEHVVFAVPVGPADTLERLEDEADEVVCLEVPDYFGAVGRHYREFGQVTDEEALAYLE